MKKQLIILISLFFLLIASTFAVNDQDGKVKIQKAGVKIYLYIYSLVDELYEESKKSDSKSIDPEIQKLQKLHTMADNAGTSILNELERSKLSSTEKSAIKSKWSSRPESILPGSEINEILSNVNNWSTQKQSIQKSIIEAQKIIESELGKSS